MEISLDEFLTESPNELTQHYQILETIGTGSFGTVIHAIEKSSNRECAIKIIPKSHKKPSLIQRTKQEIQILKHLHHNNIVQFYGYIETPLNLYIIMEYIQHGTLQSWLSSHKHNISESQASVIITHLLHAVQYLHSHGIIHRDIKPENIMLCNNNDLTSLKLIDFGLSALLLNEFQEKEYCGTFLYMSPEQLEGKMYSKGVDLWSIGIIMYMLLNKGRHPFYKKGDDRDEYIQKIKERKVKVDGCSYMGGMLLRKLLEIKTLWRYSAEKALKHPWITRNVNDDIPIMYHELLKRQGMLNKFKEMVSIAIYMNYCSKIYETGKNKFVIGEEYKEKVNKYSAIKKEYMNNKRRMGLDVMIMDKSIQSNKIPLIEDICESNVCNDNDASIRDDYEIKSPFVNKTKNVKIISLERNRDVENEKYNLKKKKLVLFKNNTARPIESARILSYQYKNLYSARNNNKRNQQLIINSKQKLLESKTVKTHKKNNKSYLPLIKPLIRNSSRDFINNNNKIKLLKTPLQLKKQKTLITLNLSNLISDNLLTSKFNRNNRITSHNTTNTTNDNSTKNIKHIRYLSYNNVSPPTYKNKQSNNEDIPLILPPIHNVYPLISPKIKYYNQNNIN